MEVLCSKRKLAFYQDDPAKGDHFTISPHPDPQEVPDWIRDTNTFKAAIKSRDLIVMPPPEAENASSSGPVPATQPAAKPRRRAKAVAVAKESPKDTSDENLTMAELERMRSGI